MDLDINGNTRVSPDDIQRHVTPVAGSSGCCYKAQGCFRLDTDAKLGALERAIEDLDEDTGAKKHQKNLVRANYHAARDCVQREQKLRRWSQAFGLCATIGTVVYTGCQVVGWWEGRNTPGVVDCFDALLEAPHLPTEEHLPQYFEEHPEVKKCFAQYEARRAYDSAFGSIWRTANMKDAYRTVNMKDATDAYPMTDAAESILSTEEEAHKEPLSPTDEDELAEKLRFLGKEKTG